MGTRSTAGRLVSSTGDNLGLRSLLEWGRAPGTQPFTCGSEFHGKTPRESENCSVWGAYASRLVADVPWGWGSVGRGHPEQCGGGVKS